MAFVDTVRDVLTIVQSSDNVDLYRRILDLQRDALQLLEERSRLAKRVEELEDQSAKAALLRFDRTVYWMEGKEGAERGPYCSACWDGGRKLVHLHDDADRYWSCPVCNTHPDKPGGGTGPASVLSNW